MGREGGLAAGGVIWNDTGGGGGVKACLGGEAASGDDVRFGGREDGAFCIRVGELGLGELVCSSAGD